MRDETLCVISGTSFKKAMQLSGAFTWHSWAAAYMDASVQASLVLFPDKGAYVMQDEVRERSFFTLANSFVSLPFVYLSKCTVQGHLSLRHSHNLMFLVSPGCKRQQGFKEMQFL